MLAEKHAESICQSAYKLNKRQRPLRTVLGSVHVWDTLSLPDKHFYPYIFKISPCMTDFKRGQEFGEFWNNDLDLWAKILSLACDKLNKIAKLFQNHWRIYGSDKSIHTVPQIHVSAPNWGAKKRIFQAIRKRTRQILSRCVTVNKHN